MSGNFFDWFIGKLVDHRENLNFYLHFLYKELIYPVEWAHEPMFHRLVRMEVMISLALAGRAYFSFAPGSDFFELLS